MRNVIHPPSFKGIFFLIGLSNSDTDNDYNYNEGVTFGFGYKGNRNMHLSVETIPNNEDRDLIMRASYLF